MRIPVEIYHHVPTKYKSMFRLNVTKAQYATLTEGKDLVIKGRFRLLNKREKWVFAPIFQLWENGARFIGVKIEEGKVSTLPTYYITY
jgi:hypothetical protein